MAGTLRDRARAAGRITVVRTALVLTAVVLSVGGCGCERGDEPPSSGAPADAKHDLAQVVAPLPESPLPWAEVLEVEPDPAIVPDAALRARLRATGLPWRVRDRGTQLELLLVPPGELLRGAAPDDAEASEDERPQHTAVVRDAFYVGRFEVTQAEWRRALGDAPSFFTAADDAAGTALPVEQVDWFRVQEFLAATGFELPTESQWEHACRAGDPAPRHGPLDEVAWHRGNAGGRPHEVGTRRANALGLHDLLGNVWEWTSSGFLADEYGRYRAPIDARARPVGTPKAVLRGGSWYDGPQRARASARYAAPRDFAAGHVGLRVLRHP